ncbi:MAG: class I SAM-dependent methyltransferase, partial [Kiritimatiellales bacterium]|nr:class I SAM-dependent methyltransferase [Kiritimatiellales bacterium]
TVDEELGWYENKPDQTLRLLNQVPGWSCSTIFLPGAGTSVLIDFLRETNATLVLNDISSVALERVRERLGDRSSGVDWVCQNIADPLGAAVPDIDIWIDRAVLHFLTEEEDIQGYFRNVTAKVKIGGHALFAEFAPHGAPKCAGLELHRYSIEELTERLGAGFALVDHFDHTYLNPAGDPRPYIYALFKREK